MYTSKMMLPVGQLVGGEDLVTVFEAGVHGLER